MVQPSKQNKYEISHVAWQLLWVWAQLRAAHVEVLELEGPGAPEESRPICRKCIVKRAALFRRKFACRNQAHTLGLGFAS